MSERGGNLKWTAPLPGLILSASYVSTPASSSGINVAYSTPFSIQLLRDHRWVLSGQYTWGNLRVEGDYSRELQEIRSQGATPPTYSPNPITDLDRRAWYAALAYRVSKHFELGAYNSRFFPNDDQQYGTFPVPLPPAARHIFDQVLTARIDITRFLDFKIEGHFIDGYGDPSSFRGFYPRDNPLGFQPTTNLLILRMGVNF